MNKSPPTTLLNLQCRICLSFNPEDESASVNNIITLLTEYCHLSVCIIYIKNCHNMPDYSRF